jgi:hypothetical protein
MGMSKARKEAEASIKYHQEQAEKAKDPKKKKQHSRIAENIRRILRINDERNPPDDGSGPLRPL